MNIDEQKRAEKFYIESDINGTHTPRTNMVEINYLDMVKLMHRYAEQQVKNNCVLPVVVKSCENCKHFENCSHKHLAEQQNRICFNS